jgi:hypothetical protein
MFSLDHELSVLKGLCAWSVKRTHGSFLSMQFGEPRLWVRSPIQQEPGASEKTALRREHRLVRAVGQWELWIEQGQWQLDWRGGHVTSDDSMNAIEAALPYLDGQAFVDFRRDDADRTCWFDFDLGAVLRVSPTEEAEAAQWNLSRDGEWIASYRNDGQVEFERLARPTTGIG